MYQAATISNLVDLCNTAYTNASRSFLLFHTYEDSQFVSFSPYYVYPLGTATLLPGDPIRNIRWTLDVDSGPKLTFPGSEADADVWGMQDDAPVPRHVTQADFFINRHGQIVIIGTAVYPFFEKGLVSDALHEDKDYD